MYPELPAALQQRVIDALQEWSKTKAEVGS
jgi:hypothetical protein